MNAEFWQTALLAELYPENIALLFNDGSSCQKISYQQLDDLVSKAKEKLVKAQLIKAEATKPLKKQLLMLVARHSINSIVYYLAALQLKQVVWWVDKELAADKLQKLAHQYRVNMLLDDGEITHLDDFEHKLHPQLALLITTSGSTGSPTLVRLSYQNLNSNCRAICQILAIQSSDKVITTLPLQYSFGLSIVNTHLNQGSTIVLNEDTLLSREFWQTFREHEISCLYGVPYSYEMLLKLKLARLPLNSLRFFAVAGGKLAPKRVTEINQWCLAQQKLFYVMYGQTEATARIGVLAPEKVAIKPYSIGQSIPDGKLWIEHDKNQPVREEGQVGQLCYRGDNVMMGLADNLQALSLAAQTDVLRTGDLAVCDVDGDYTIVGRLKRFVKVIGHRINLDEVEQFLLSEQLVVACSGQDDLLRCYLVKSSLQPGQKIEDCQRLLGDYLQIHSRYCQWQLINELPYLASGKINYPQLEKTILAKCPLESQL